VRAGDEGSRAVFHFCPRCGVTVYYEAEPFPDFVTCRRRMPSIIHSARSALAASAMLAVE